MDTTPFISVLYFSGYGHTHKQALAVAKGAATNAFESRLIRISDNGTITDDEWQMLSASTAIIFGSPTYMGAPAWQFKKLADQSSKPWFAQEWRDKVAAGFTNSSGINGDKNSSIQYFFTFAMQHSMLWVGTGLMPSSGKASARDDVNWLGGFSGALAQSPNDASPEEAPGVGDLETARLLGVRVAAIAGKLRAA